MIPLHVRPMVVVVVDELRDHVIQVSLSKDDELVEALPAYRADKSLAPAVQIR